jgi:urate oxidase
MPIQIQSNNYGKSRVRLVKVTRQEGRHDLKEITFHIQLEGDFETAHTQGDNTQILPTDTMKNTVYALAKDDKAEQIEEFAVRLADFFVGNNPQVSRARVEAIEQIWNRALVGGKPHAHTFTRGAEKRTTLVTGTRDGTKVESGIDDLVILKTTDSSFEGYVKDPFTTLKEATDRIFATALKAVWTYSGPDVPYGPHWHGVRQTMLETFALHKSKSVQHTMYAMGEAVLSSFDEISEIRLSLPNRHCLLVDLSPFGLENNNEIFVPTDEPHGLIEAVLRRS